MKVLIGYDGSDCAVAALDDLRNAGLPAHTEALVLAVTENWTMIFEELEKDDPQAGTPFPNQEVLDRIREKGHAAFAETEKMVAAAAERLKSDFPSWKIESSALPGFAHWGVLETSEKWKPDLIVVGSHGRNAIGRAVLGSSSLKILSEALCSVRVARMTPSRTPDDDSPVRVVIGFDGSPDAQKAVESVAGRAWRQNSAARLVTSIDPFIAGAAGFEPDIEKVRVSQQEAVRRLEAAGLHVSTAVRIGDAKKVLVEEAEKWGADAIFVGAKGHSFIDRVLLGSVSYAAAARAHCAVEVVR